MAAHERDPEDEDGRKNALKDHGDNSLKEGLTRLGTWGEVSLIFVLILTVLYLFTFSHGNTRFSRPLRLQANGWMQPREEAKNWAHQHALYAAKAAVDDAELIFYGDSVFEIWRGTVHMESDPRGHGVPEIFHKYFGKVYKTAVFAISGDAAPNLMWRVQNGEAPLNLRSLKAAVVLIGSNDLTYASFQGDDFIASAGNQTAVHILAVAERIHQAASSSSVILLGLLPRGDQTLMPDPAMFSQPSKFTPTIREINSLLESYAATRGHLSFLDCGTGLLDTGSAAINRTLMPDARHPSAEGKLLLRVGRKLLQLHLIGQGLHWIVG